MRNIVVSAIAVTSAVAIATLWRSKDDGATVAIDVSEQAPERTEQQGTARAAEPLPAAVTAAAVAAVSAAPDEVRVDHGHDDGDDHDHEQGELRPLEVPPPSREEFGADPASDGAALAEARAVLEGLLEDPDPQLRAEVATLLETIEAAQ